MSIFRKKKVFRHALDKYVYQISGLRCFSFGKRVRHTLRRQLTDKYTSKYKNIPFRLHTSCGFDNWRYITKNKACTHSPEVGIYNSEAFITLKMLSYLRRSVAFILGAYQIMDGVASLENG